MATIDKNFADQIIERNGYYPGDPRVRRVIKYTNAAGVDAYAVEYDWEIGRYAPSEFVIDPKVIWEAK